MVGSSVLATAAYAGEALESRDRCRWRLATFATFNREQFVLGAYAARVLCRLWKRIQFARAGRDRPIPLVDNYYLLAVPARLFQLPSVSGFSGFASNCA